MRRGQWKAAANKIPTNRSRPRQGGRMTKEEIDILWHKAMRLSIEDGDQFTRYRFAELVAEAERNRTWTQDHWTEYERSIAAAAKAEEREACAKVCESMRGECWAYDHDRIAAAIRARSNT
jgi:hypothetical protein